MKIKSWKKSSHWRRAFALARTHRHKARLELLCNHKAFKWLALELFLMEDHFRMRELIAKKLRTASPFVKLLEKGAF